jgi:hypothetical protein
MTRQLEGAAVCADSGGAVGGITDQHRPVRGLFNQ